jgi:hypothetical protein
VEGFNPQPDNAVDSLLKSADGAHLYAGGLFNRIGGCTPCDRLAMLDPATGTANPSFHPQPNASVLKMALYGRTLYFGGKFTSVAGTARVRLAADGRHHRTGLAPSSPGAQRGRARPRLNSTGSTLYLAGSFTKIGITTRYNFASVRAASRALTGWNPNIHASGWGIALSPSNTTAYMTTADGNESVCNAGHESVIAMAATGSGTPAVLWHNGGDAGCPFNSGDINAIRGHRERGLHRRAPDQPVHGHEHLVHSQVPREPHRPQPRGRAQPHHRGPAVVEPGADGTRGVLVLQSDAGRARCRRRLPPDQRRRATASSPCSAAPRKRHRDAPGRSLWPGPYRPV